MKEVVFSFEKPLGMRDVLPHEYEVTEALRGAMVEQMKRAGYAMIATPTLEYEATVGKSSAIMEQQLFRLLDRDGHTLVLRPDMTAPIARIAASTLLTGEYPIRLGYDAPVFRAQQLEGGRPAEFAQVGVELIGDATVSADAEVIALMVDVLQAAGVEQFRIAIGHIQVVRALLLDILGNEQRAELLIRFLYEKNYVGYREHVKQLPLSTIDQDRLLALLRLRGMLNLEQLRALIGEHEAIEQLAELWTFFAAYGIEQYVTLDLTLVHHMSYYTGLLFEVVSGNVGFPLGSGGRYDELLGEFHCPAPATGFGLRLDRILEATTKEVAKREKTLVLYSRERKEEAIAFARQQRVAGAIVVMQQVNGVRNLDAYTAEFHDVQLLIGKGKSE